MLLSQSINAKSFKTYLDFEVVQVYVWFKKDKITRLGSIEVDQLIYPKCHFGAWWYEIAYFLLDTQQSIAFRAVRFTMNVILSLKLTG